MATGFQIHWAALLLWCTPCSSVYCYQYRRNANYYNRELTELVRKLGDERIMIVPIHQAIDPVDSYITTETKAHARSSRSVIRFNNGLHPTREGGCQIGDAIASWLIVREGRRNVSSPKQGK